MSKQKYLMILSLFIILIISLTAVSAAEDTNNTDLLKDSSQDNEYDLKIDGTDGETEGTVEGSTFEDIQSEIDNADDGATIDLNGNFISTGNEIHISKSITIDGHKSTTLDGKGLSRIFYLDHVKKLTVNGVKFTNSKFYGDGTTRWNNGYADEYSFTDCDFQDNIGYFLEISSKKATFTNCNFLNNDITLFMLDSDDLTVKNCKFAKNTNTVILRAKLIDRCTFENNRPDYFELIGTVQSITNSNFIKNYLTIKNAGTMYNNRFESNDYDDYMITCDAANKCVFKKNTGNIFKKCTTIKDSTFESNKGDIAASASTVVNCKFISNKANNVFLKASSITNSYFKNNKNFYVNGKNLIVKNSNFINNKGYVSADKIDKCSFFKNDLTIKSNTVTNSKFTKNSCWDYMLYCGKTVKKCQFIQNKCHSTMIYTPKTVSDSKFIKNTCVGLITDVKTVKNCRFEKNKFATSEGGSLVSGVKLLKNCVFKNNKGKYGSPVSDVKLVFGCTFKNNKVSHFMGGAIYYVKKVVNSKFYNNYALYSGGAINDVSYLKNCIFKNNRADGGKMDGGGAVSTSGKLTVIKCTFQNNKIRTAGSAIFLTAINKNVKVVIKNSKFIKNKSKNKIKTYNYPFKSYKKGTVFAYGDMKMKFTFIKCKGL